MVGVPAPVPVTMPVALTLAIAVLLLLHTPPVAVSDKVMEEPWQTTVGPDIGLTAAAGFIVMILVATAVPQLLVTLYFMVSVPVVSPVTVPVVFTVAIVVNTLLHVPPLVASVRVMVEPTHTAAAPAILPALAAAVTTTFCDTVKVPQGLVTV